MENIFENAGDIEAIVDAGGVTSRPYLKKFAPPESDEDVPDLQKVYNVQASWRTLLSLPSCQKVMITDAVQKALKLQVGQNVTQEFPWKQVKYKDLRDVLFEELENSADIVKQFTGFNPENFVLIGYCPTLTESDEDPPEGDPFIFYINGKDTKLAMAVIQNMEAFERWRMQRRLRKKPRRWVSMGTENEMTIMVQHFQDEPVDVEIQSVYPIQQPRHVAFQRRMARDVRDGVIELLPNESVKYDNIIKRRISVGVQVAPACNSQEQQTNPTFPSNAWSQYLYELDDADLELDESEKEEEDLATQRSRPDTPATEIEVPKPPPEMSSQIKLLLQTLDFNQIDSYRNDYQLITNRQVKHYANPFLEEYICFANIAKSCDRFVASCDWYPSRSGLLAVSYTFSTPVFPEIVTSKIEPVKRAIHEPNPVLLWSFSDNLNYKLEFYAHFQVSCLSFYPFDGNILIGGCQNGVLLFWDLQGKCEHLDEEEYLTPDEAKYRAKMEEFLSWAIDPNAGVIVQPASMSPFESSPAGAITGIYWLSKHVYLNKSGKVFHDPDKSNHHKFFVTCSFDGTVSFWNLEGEKAPAPRQRPENLPKELIQNVSPLKSKIFKPVYSLYFDEPLTGLVGDTSVFFTQTPSLKVINSSPANFPTTMVAKDPPEMRQSLILSTYYGHIVRVEWQGMHSEEGVKEVVTSSATFPPVHNGPVVTIKKNPFYPEVFASIGGSIFGIWKDDYPDSAIMWRKRPCALTAIAWSESRPAVLYITRSDGVLEAWDIMVRDGDPVLTEVLGGGFITAIIEHRPSLPHKVLGIGDYNSSIRMVKLPHNFSVPLDNELDNFIHYVLRQINRKKNIKEWELKYNEKNKDIIEAKRAAEEEARKDMERLEREQALKKRQSETDEIPDGKTHKISGIPYNERMAQKFDELNLNRMMTILMSRKQMDPEKLARETALEKDRLSYEAAKKESHARLVETINDDIASIRSRILPVEVTDMQRNELIAKMVREEMANAESYESVAAECQKLLENFPDPRPMDFIEILERANKRRELLDKSLGGNNDRLLWYNEKVRDNQLYECDFGVDLLYNRGKLGPQPKDNAKDVQALSTGSSEELKQTSNKSKSDTSN